MAVDFLNWFQEANPEAYQQGVDNAAGNIVGYDVDGNPQYQGKWDKFWKGSQNYAQTPEDFQNSFQNINQYTDQAAGHLFGTEPDSIQNTFLQGALNQAQVGYTPEAGFRSMMGADGRGQELLDFFQGAQSPLQQAIDQYSTTASNQANQDVRSNFSDRGSLYGSGAMNEAYRASEGIRQQQAAQNSANLMNAFTGAYGQERGLADQSNQFQSNLEASQRGQDIGYGMNLLGMQSSFGDPMYAQQQMQYNPSGFDKYVMPILQEVAGRATGQLFGGDLVGNLGNTLGQGVDYARDMYSQASGTPYTYNPTPTFNNTPGISATVTRRPL